MGSGFAPTALADPAQADPANAAALKEYDYTGGASATYKREGETLSVRALRFQDASGAYGAYSFYRQNGWPKEEIGAGATSDHNRVLFWMGNTVVDATFSHIGPMSAAEMRELASHVPDPPGTSALTPPILANLPQDSLDGQTTHYALGPAGYAGAGGVLPPELVGFDRGAEAVTANYSLRSGPATLTIIDYPTPQMAAAQETEDSRLHQGRQQSAAAPGPSRSQDSDLASLEVRRSGPLVAMVSGDAIPDESHKLLEMVHYEADLTSIPQPTESEVAKTGQAAAGHRRHGDRRQQRRPSARVLPRRRPGALPHRARQAGLLGLRRGVHSHRFAGRMGRNDSDPSKVRIRRVNCGLCLWKTGHKPEETPLK